MVRTRIGSRGRPGSAGSPVALDVNAVVSYNLKAIRERRGMTQQVVAERLGALTGHQLPQASISAMERGFDGERRRRFDAHELYLLSTIFDVPIVYFFLPPPEAAGALLADTGRPVPELYKSVLGSDAQACAVDDRIQRSGACARPPPPASSEPCSGRSRMIAGARTFWPGGRRGCGRSNASTARKSTSSPTSSDDSPPS